MPTPEAEVCPLGHLATFFKSVRVSRDRQCGKHFLSSPWHGATNPRVPSTSKEIKSGGLSKQDEIHSLSSEPWGHRNSPNRANFGRHNLFWKLRLTFPFSRAYGNELSGPSPAAAPIPGAQICIPGTSVSCTCPSVGLSSTANGMLYCNSNGSAYSSCICQPQREALLLVRWAWEARLTIFPLNLVALV